MRVHGFLAHPTGSTPPLARDNTAPGPSLLAYRQPPLPRSPFDQHEPSVLAHPPPGNVHLVDLELEQRQALGFAHSIRSAMPIGRAARRSLIEGPTPRLN